MPHNGARKSLGGEDLKTHCAELDCMAGIPPSGSLSLPGPPPLAAAESLYIGQSTQCTQKILCIDHVEYAAESSI